MASLAVCRLGTRAAAGDPTLGPPFSPHNSDRDCAHSCSPLSPTMHCIRGAPGLSSWAAYRFHSSPQRHKPGVLLQIPEEMSKREERCSQEVLMMFDKQIGFHMCTSVHARVPFTCCFCSHSRLSLEHIWLTQPAAGERGEKTRWSHQRWERERQFVDTDTADTVVVLNFSYKRKESVFERFLIEGYTVHSMSVCFDFSANSTLQSIRFEFFYSPHRVTQQTL